MPFAFWRKKSTTSVDSPARWFIDWARGGSTNAAGVVVNASQTSYEWRPQMQQHLSPRGNAYNWVERDGPGRVLALWPLHPDRVRMLESPDCSTIFAAGRPMR